MRTSRRKAKQVLFSSREKISGAPAVTTKPPTRRHLVDKLNHLQRTITAAMAQERLHEGRHSEHYRCYYSEQLDSLVKKRNSILGQFLRLGYKLP